VTRAAIYASALAAVGCAHAAFPSATYCHPPAPPAAWAIPEGPPPPSDADRVERLAALIGLRGVVLELRSQATLSADSRRLAVERIQTVRVLIGATAAQLGCESLRASEAADFLSREGATAVQGLTIASVLVAAGTTIAGVFLSTNDAKSGVQVGVAIGGGAVTAGLGLGSLYVHPTLDFPHPHNLLAEVWRGPRTSAEFPGPVWAYLTRPEFSNDQKQSIRESMIERWRMYGTVESDASAIALLFGAGGRYDVDRLRTRAAMLDQVRAEVELENQEIAALATEILR
jgi:hypothetical protein